MASTGSPRTTPLLDRLHRPRAKLRANCDVNGDPVDRGLLDAAVAGELALVTRDDELLDAAPRKGVIVLNTRC